MHIYISGKIAGLPINEVETKFQQAESLLEKFGGKVANPLKNRQTKEPPYNENMIRGIEMLMECDSVLMLDNWRESTIARIEYDIAIRLGKNIYFESNIAYSHKVVLQIQEAIHEVMGLRFDEYTTKSRKNDVFFARMMFVYHCHKNNVNPIQYIHRDRTMIYHYLERYDDEVKYNPSFRKLAQMVDEKLSQIT
ncbi:DUF4406 domain-containing protein [Bacteroides sp. 224]|uniref:DUF4406 domain-containing protein n=1 Tax=Bacteroides sp. 224 TaxID=2302936 RepID=UPI0013D07060|nr:DUF4406 domain-containing protein [Bacteroides sp. 224]NDV63777.1 DUF4406 domain-containing protein [Bacteroides sp. 224]